MPENISNPLIFYTKFSHGGETLGNSNAHSHAKRVRPSSGINHKCRFPAGLANAMSSISMARKGMDSRQIVSRCLEIGRLNPRHHRRVRIASVDDDPSSWTWTHSMARLDVAERQTEMSSSRRASIRAATGHAEEAIGESRDASWQRPFRSGVVLGKMKDAVGHGEGCAGTAGPACRRRLPLARRVHALISSAVEKKLDAVASGGGLDGGWTEPWAGHCCNRWPIGPRRGRPWRQWGQAWALATKGWRRTLPRQTDESTTMDPPHPPNSPHTTRTDGSTRHKLMGWHAQGAPKSPIDALDMFRLAPYHHSNHPPVPSRSHMSPAAMRAGLRRAGRDQMQR